MPKVELIYDRDCPNIIAARTNLKKSLAQARLSPEWVEWDRGSPEAPAYVKGYGSPTILVDGRDIAGEQVGSENSSCRIYLDSSEINKGSPSLEMIARTLLRSSRTSNSGKAAGIFGVLAVGPGVTAAVLAKAACPLCYPAIAGLLSSVGLGFLLDGTYLVITAVLFLAIVLFGLGYRARSRRGYGPFLLGLASSAIVIAAKFLWDESVPLYAGVAGLIGASAWNLIPKRHLTGSCPSCVMDGADLHGAKGE